MTLCTVQQPICRVILQISHFEAGNFITLRSFFYDEFTHLKKPSIIIFN